MIIGIDLGTTNSLVSLWQDGKAQIIPNALGVNLTPSAVSLDEKHTVIVGQAAKERLPTHPDRTAVNFKRFMGTDRQIKLGKKSFRAEELSSFVIRSLVADAEAYLNEKITEAIITVPAYFSDAQRKATKVAGELAGLKVERLLNEPTAAAMAYGFHANTDEARYLVFDLGGGTFDVSILEMFDGVMEVHASAGDNHLGGTDFTEAIYSLFVEKSDFHSIKVKPEKIPLELEQKIKVQAEKAKKEICDKGKSELKVLWGDKTLALDINEAAFEDAVDSLLKRLARPIRSALRDAKIRVDDIDEIVLVGGATRMPCIRKMATRLFQRFPASGIHPDEVVAQGAAVQAGLKMRDQALDDVVMTDVCPYTLGIETAKGDDAQRVAGYYQPIIERNNYIPISRVERFYTVYDNQTQLEVRVFQGESALVRDNIFLGSLNVKIPKGEAGRESIDVRFTYDINGLLEVIVTVISTNQTHSLVIEENPGILSEKEIQERFKQLEKLKIHPRDQQENIAITSRAERLYEDLRGDDRNRLGEIIADFHRVLERQDPREIKSAQEKMLEILTQIEGAYEF